MLGKAGTKGIAIIPVYDQELASRSFFIQFRAEDYKSKIDVSPGAIGKTRSLLVMSRMPLSFCPRCGENLATLIDQDKEGFDALSQKYQNLAL